MTAAAALARRLFAPVDIASLAYFRVAFGAIMLWETWRYFEYGWIPRYWIDPDVHFTYYGFDWVRPWPGIGMYVHWAALGVLAAALMAGAWYRLAATLFFLGFTYTFLLEQARYLNHFYLICLLSFILIFVPAHRAFSIDALRRPALRSATAPAWALWLLRFQIGIPYFYGGVAKLNADWLRGEPLRQWLANRSDFAIVGALFTEPWFVQLAIYGSLLLDLLIVPLLLWRRTRLVAFVLAALFALANARLFSIGIFPWLMIAATAMFFPPDWPRRLLARWWPSARAPVSAAIDPLRADPPPSPRWRRLIVAALGAYAAVQLLVPLRHYVYAGDVNWTEEGHRFSWHMKLRSKMARVDFLVTDSLSGETGRIDPEDEMAGWQARKMMTRPDMILQFSHHLAGRLRPAGRAQEHVVVRVHAVASLNGRRPQTFIDSTVNLARERRTLGPARWIVPLDGAARPGEQWVYSADEWRDP